MPKLPRISGKELLKLLQKNGFRVVRTKGSHHFIAHWDGRCTVVPIHGKEELGPGLLRKILRDLEMSVEQLVDLLQE